MFLKKKRLYSAWELGDLSAHGGSLHPSVNQRNSNQKSIHLEMVTTRQEEYDLRSHESIKLSEKCGVKSRCVWLWHFSVHHQQSTIKLFVLFKFRMTLSFVLQPWCCKIWNKGTFNLYYCLRLRCNGVEARGFIKWKTLKYNKSTSNVYLILAMNYSILSQQLEVNIFF